MDILRTAGTHECNPLIRGYFDTRFRSPLPVVLSGLVLPHRSEAYTPVEFVVDTGAAASALHPADAIRRLSFTEEDFVTVRRVARQRRAVMGITGVADYYYLVSRQPSNEG